MFKDRAAAGIQLASRLKEYKSKEGVLVLALPRGGVVTGYEIAKSLNVPLDIIIVRKIGFPGQPEFGIGAVSETGTVVLNDNIISAYGISKEYIEGEISKQKEEISRRIKFYRKDKRLSGLEGKTVILVDDGVATGVTMKVAIVTLKEEKLKRLIVALPVAPPSTAEELEKMVDEFICIETPDDFMAVGSYYYDFTQVSDEEVIEFLKLAAQNI
ncbi:MAG: phosphoribosyltransferase [Thermodesulfovibrionales bacterium]